MGQAWIDGRPVALHAALSEAATVLDGCRAPVVAGLGTDVAGTRAAIALAQRLGAAFDHMHSEVVLRDIAVIRGAGMMLTTPSVTRLRADLLFLVGACALDDWPDAPERFLAPPAASPSEHASTRRVIRLCPGRGATSPVFEQAQVIGRSAADLPVLLAALRARVAGRPTGKTVVAAKSLDAVADELCAAHFGVALWSARELDDVSIEMLCGLVDDLNAKTRFTGLPLGPGDNALGVLAVCGWTTGFPMRIGFARGHPEHDPWRFDAARLVESGEADGALWISAYRAAVPTWSRRVPLIALTAAETSFGAPPRVHIEVGRPGTDHDAVEHCPLSGTLVPRVATAPSRTISVTDAIAHITMALGSTGALSC
jgi:formylmethanofuran dehydrogenase subunit B